MARFKPGMLSSEEARQLNELVDKVNALLKFAASNPLSVVRSSTGQTNIYLDPCATKQLMIDANCGSDYYSGGTGNTVIVPHTIRCEGGDIVYDTTTYAFSGAVLVEAL